MLKVISALLSAALVGGCVTNSNGFAANYDPNEVAWAKAGGSGSIVGTVHAVAVDGRQFSCIGRFVTLIPASTYSNEVVELYFGNLDHGRREFDQGTNLPLPERKFEHDLIRTPCNSENEFVFERIADGIYYAVVNLSARVHEDREASVRNSGLGIRGLAIMRRVKVENGALTRLDLS